ncbi:hypothetical protein IAR55_001632 [Kwoniella newhampshirensis]|uniref:Uncharacterized protein n=1 Tax=Kwoniella newhampshirensis TaxID=1651941 RepID=A0AAW0Z2J5_9TREE
MAFEPTYPSLWLSAPDHDTNVAVWGSPILPFPSSRRGTSTAHAEKSLCRCPAQPAVRPTDWGERNMTPLTHRTRSIPLLVVLALVVSILYLQNGPAEVEYTFPQGVLVDYTSPSTHCFWPQTEDEVGKGSESANDRLRAGTIKDWIGWRTSTSSDRKGAASDSDGYVGHSVNDGFTWEGQLPDVIPVNGIEEYMLAHIEDLQNGHDPQHDFEEYGLNLGNISLSSYTAELLSTYREYLLPEHLSSSPPSRPPSYLPPVLSRLSLRPPIAPLPPRPNQVMTTEKSVGDLPEEFGRWKEIMPDWEIKYYDDPALKAWVKGVFGGSKAQKIWDKLPRQVLKTDVFRYMAMLVEGGIYTDS